LVSGLCIDGILVEVCVGDRVLCSPCCAGASLPTD
jgi:hypothetical protein